jgi:hypothetical protein
VRYSGVKVQATRLMGLSVWDATSQDDLPQEQGAVVRLVLADQTQAEGSLLLCVQERGAESRYLGQRVVTQGDGQTTLALTSGVLGGGNSLRGGYGCLPQHAATIAATSGRVFWYCHERRELVRYAQNGVQPLALSYQFQTRLTELGDAVGSLPAVGGYDPRRGEVWLCLGGVDTVAWSERRESWVDSYATSPECVAHVGQTLLTFQDAQAWRHSDTAPYGRFFGLYTAPRLTFTSAAPGTKLWKSIVVESEAKWLPTLLSVEGRMLSRMRPEWLTYLEGVYRGAFRRDETSNGGLLAGRPLVGERLTVTLTAPEGQEGVSLAAAAVGWVPRGGQL